MTNTHQKQKKYVKDQQNFQYHISEYNDVQHKICCVNHSNILSIDTSSYSSTSRP